jgi:hypothetical protein
LAVAAARFAAICRRCRSNSFSSFKTLLKSLLPVPGNLQTFDLGSLTRTWLEPTVE